MSKGQHKYANALLTPQAFPLFLPDAIDRFAQQMDADGKSIHTKTSYLRYLRYFREWAGDDTHLSAVSPAMLPEYITQAGNRQVSGEAKANTSVNHVKSSLRSFFTWAFHLGYVTENPARGIRVKHMGRRIPEHLTPEQKAKLLATMAEEDSPAARRDRVLVELFLTTGMRLNEALSLDVSDVDLDQKRVILRQAKGGGQVVKPISTGLAASLEDYLVWREDQTAETDALFISQVGRRLSGRQVQLRMKGWFAKAGLSEDLTVHSLRHSFATHLYRKTRNILLVQKALDHRHITTTQIYAHIDDAELAAAVELV